MPFATANGLTLHYAITGAKNAPWLVFANSLGTDFRIWDGVVARLGERFRILLYDKRGHGLSDIGTSPYAIDDHVADLAALMDGLGIGEATVCGLSVGGLIAQGLYHHHPDKVCGLVLCDTAHRIGTVESWQERLDGLAQSGIEGMADLVMQLWFSKGFRESQPTAVAGYRNMLTRIPYDGYAGTVAVLRDTDFTAQAGDIRVPTMALVGSEDMATTPELMAEMAQLMGGIRLETIEGVGHLPCLEKPKEVARLIGEFATEHELA